MNGKTKVNKTAKFISENYNFYILLKMSDLKVAKSKRGINITFENYRYIINRKTQTTYYLKCVRSCGATMLTNPEITQVIRPRGLHSHPEESEQIEYEKIRQKMLKLANKDPTNVLKNIYDNVLEQHPSSIVPDYKSVRSSLYRKRSEKVSPVPKTIKDIEFRGRWRNSYARARFLIYHNVGFGVTIFATDDGMRVLSECDNILCDGTFKSCPSPYYVLYVIVGFWENRFIPLVFSFLSGKTTFHYRRLFGIICRRVRRSQDRREFPKES